MTDQELIQQFQTGAEHAFNELVKRHYQTTFQFFSRMLKDPMEADDLCQETYIRVFKGLKGFRMQSEFTTWLYRISANVANNYFRKRRVAELFTSGAAIQELSADPAREDRRLDERTWHAIRHLPRKQRMVLMLRIFQELPFKEVAAIMDITENSAKVNYHYAVKNLRKRLGESIVTSLEERLRNMARMQVHVPEADDFVARLHSEMGRRTARKQSLLNSAVSLGAVTLILFGVIRNGEIGNEDYYPVFTEYEALLSEEETAEATDIFSDETFVLEALDYLVAGSDFIGNGWELLQELEEFGLVDSQIPQNREKSL